MAKKKTLPNQNTDRKKIKFIGGFAIFLLAGGSLYFGVKPFVEQLGDSNGEIAAATQQTGSLSSQLSQLQTTAKNTDAVDKFREQFVAKFPEQADASGLITNIANSAVSAGIPASDITSYSFQAPAVSGGATGAATSATGAAAAPTTTGSGTAGASTTPSTGTGAATTSGGAASGGGQLAGMTLSLTVKGSPSQFATFLNRLTTMDRSFSVSTFAVAGGSGDGTLTLTGTTYLHSHITTPEEAIKTGSTGTAASGATGTAATGTAGATPATGATGAAATGTTGN